MDGLFQPTHLIIILLIVMVLFGGKKLPELGKGLGEAIRGFRSAMKDGDGPNPPGNSNGGSNSSNSNNTKPLN